MPDTSSAVATRRTRRRILGSGAVILAAIVTTGVVGWELTAFTGFVSVATWTGTTTFVAAGLSAYTYRYAAENVTEPPESGDVIETVAQSHAYDTLGLPTTVTLGRGVLVAGVVGIAGLAAVGGLGSLTDRWAWVAAIAYGVAAALDSVDGSLARRMGRTTKLGGRLDTAVDALGLLVVPLAGVFLGEIPWWYLSVGLARYVFLAGLWWRTRTGRPTFDLPPRSSRRVLAGLQMTVVPVALAPDVADRVMPLVVGVAAGGLLLGFCRDWLYVSGRLESERRIQPTKTTTKD